MMLSAFSVLLLCTPLADTQPAETLQKSPPPVATNQLPAEFLENQGQWPDTTVWRGRIGPQVVSFDRDGVRVHVIRETGTEAVPAPPPKAGIDTTDQPLVHPASTFAEHLVFGLVFESPRAAMKVEGVKPAPGTRSMFVGEASRWATDLRACREVIYRGVVDGVDVRFHVRDGALKYDVLAAPGASLDRVVFRCEGVDALAVSNGALDMHIGEAVITQPAPFTYVEHADAERQALDCQFRILGDTRLGFQVPDWDGTAPLVIDPGLKVGTFVGSGIGDLVFAMQIASNGDVILAGETWGLGFPTTPGAHRGSGSQKEGFLARLDAEGRNLLHATYFGGSADDSIFDLRLDDQDMAVFCGFTSSTDLPTTPGVYQRNFRGGNSDIFVARMDIAEGATPQMVTYLGSPDDDMGLQAELHPNGDIFIGGITNSPLFPFNFQSYDPSYNGNVDVVLARLSANGKVLEASTYLGGTASDGYFSAYYIPLRLAYYDNALYVGSQTYSDDFPTIFGVAQDSHRGKSDLFVTKMSQDLSSLILSTYLGGSDAETLSGMRVDPNGDVVITGYTGSLNFPVTSNAYDMTYNGTPVFFVESTVTVMQDDFSRWDYSTFLGGQGHDIVRDFAIESSGTLVLAGTSDSGDFPITPNAYDTTKNGPGQGIAGQDGFVTRLDTTRGTNGVLYSTWLGGGSLDLIKFVRLDSVKGSYYLTGDTQSSDFPTSAGAYDASHNGSLDVFFARLCLASWENFGQGLAGTLGVPSFTLDQPPVQGSTVTFSLDNSAGIPTFGLAFVGTSANLNSGGNPGEIHVDPITWVLVPLSVGVNQFLWNVPTTDLYCGLPVHVQVLELDTGAPNKVSFTPALQMVVGG